MNEDTKERIREILDNLLNYQEKELNEKDIYELSNMKRELKSTREILKNNLQDISLIQPEREQEIRSIKANLSRIELALENISYIVAESVIVIGNNGNEENEKYDEIENESVEEKTDDINIESDSSELIKKKLEKRKEIKDPLEAFFISYTNANELIKKIKEELKDNNKK